jgi:hypothetical protein
MLRVFALLWAAVWLAVPSATPQEARPKVPPGRDPGGVAVALVCTGIDYTLPAIAARLARDGEGELIGWDLERGDNRPFDRSRGTTPQVWGGDGTAMASAIVEAVGVRLVPIRAVPSEPASLARALAFAARTPARIVIVPMQTADRRDWDQFAQAATRFKHLLVIAIAATNETAEPAYPAALGLENVLAVAPQSSSGESQGFGGMRVQVPGAHLALAAVAKAAAAILAREPRIETADLKRRLMQDERPAR